MLRVDGTPSSPGSYAAVSRRFRLAKGTLVGAAGMVKQGGIVLGLLNSQDKWATQTAISVGPFRTAVEVPADGEYRIVIANNLPTGQQTNDAEITEVGLVGLDPATVRADQPK